MWAAMDQSHPVLAYLGPESEVVFLQTLLESSGINSSIDRPNRGQNGVRPARLFIAQNDLEEARPLLQDFKENGTKSGA